MIQPKLQKIFCTRYNKRDGTNILFALSRFILKNLVKNLTFAIFMVHFTHIWRKKSKMETGWGGETIDGAK